MCERLSCIFHLWEQWRFRFLFSQSYQISCCIYTIFLLICKNTKGVCTPGVRAFLHGDTHLLINLSHDQHWDRANLFYREGDVLWDSRRSMSGQTTTVLLPPSSPLNLLFSSWSLPSLPYSALMHAVRIRCEHLSLSSFTGWFRSFSKEEVEEERSCRRTSGSSQRQQTCMRTHTNGLLQTLLLVRKPQPTQNLKHKSHSQRLKYKYTLGLKLIKLASSWARSTETHVCTTSVTILQIHSLPIVKRTHLDLVNMKRSLDLCPDSCHLYSQILLQKDGAVSQRTTRFDPGDLLQIEQVKKNRHQKYHAWEFNSKQQKTEIQFVWKFCFSDLSGVNPSPQTEQ